MATQETVNAPAPTRERRTGSLVLAAIVATLAVALVGTLLYFSFAKQPIAVAGTIVVGPECLAQPATRVEASYNAARENPSGPKASRTEFAGIKFYRNVPWGSAEQAAPVGPQ